MLALFLKSTKLSEADYHGFHVTIFFSKISPYYDNSLFYMYVQITKLKIASNPFAKGFREATRHR